jgi:hypothetical protein
MSLLGAVAIVVALTVQIAEQIETNSFVPENYFAYFSIQTSIINMIALLISGLSGFSTTRDSRNWSALRAHLVAYAVITAAVYNVLLRERVADLAEVSLVQWPNEVTHVWIPVYLVLDWILNPHRSKLSATSLSVGLALPLIWVAGTLVRGEITGWYPYYFMDPSSDAGLVVQSAYIGVIGLVIIVTLAAAGLVNRIHDSLLPTKGLRS